MLKLSRLTSSRVFSAYQSVRSSYVPSRAAHLYSSPRAVFAAATVFSTLTAAAAVAGASRVYADYTDLESDDLEAGPQIFRARERSQFIEDKLRQHYQCNDQDIYENNGVKFGSTIVESEAATRMGEYSHDHNVDVHVNRRWVNFIICNGYDGSVAAHEVRDGLAKAVMHDIGNLLSPSHNEGISPPTPGEICAAIKNTFLSLDYSLHTVASRALLFRDTETEDNLVGEQMGSTALFVSHDVVGRRVYVANTGDGRAVLGRRSKDGSYDFRVLVGEARQDGSERPSRMFGSARHKWSPETQEALWKQRLDISLPSSTSNTREGQRMTAEPVVASARVKPGDFIIFGSRGFWESLSNEEAVGLVGLWLDNDRKWGSKTTSSATVDPDALPVRRKSIRTGNSSQTDDTLLYKRWQAEKRFTTKPTDDPCLHLARNAVGGADESLAYWLLSMKKLRAREWRKDMAIGILVIDKEPLVTPIHNSASGSNINTSNDTQEGSS